MGPLSGVRVVEMDAIGPVPLAAMLLADMGADVVRLARPDVNPPFDVTGLAVLGRSRRAVTLDLKSEAGRAAALAMIGAADAVIEGYRPGVMERLGLGPEACLAANPKLVYGRMTGWGQSGPLAERAGHDLNYIALSGALGAMGEAGRPPAPPLNLIGDYGGGTMFLVFGVLAGILHARESGRGQVVDAAMTDGVAMLLSLITALRQAGEWSGARGDNLLDGGAPFYRCYGCACGGFVSVAALEPKFFAALLEGLGLAPERFAQYDRACWDEMTAAFAAAFAGRTRAAWEAVFEGTDACVAPVLSLAEAPEHPQNRDRGVYEAREGVVHPAPAPRLSRTPGRIGPARMTSADEVLAAWGQKKQ